MEQVHSPLTPAEWHVMECLWQHAPCTGREATVYLSRHAGWSRSTTLTMLRRMSEKGFIACQEANGINTYSPLLKQEDATLLETQSFLQRVYSGSAGDMIAAFIREEQITPEERDRLRRLLDDMEV